MTIFINAFWNLTNHLRTEPAIKNEKFYALALSRNEPSETSHSFVFESMIKVHSTMVRLWDRSDEYINICFQIC